MFKTKDIVSIVIKFIIIGMITDGLNPFLLLQPEIWKILEPFKLTDTEIKIVKKYLLKKDDKNE